MRAQSHPGKFGRSGMRAASSAARPLTMRMLGLQLALLLTMGSAMGAAAGQSPASGPMPAANAVTPAAVSDPAQTDSTVSADVGAEQMEQLPESGRDWRE